MRENNELFSEKLTDSKNYSDFKENSTIYEIPGQNISIHIAIISSYSAS